MGPRLRGPGHGQYCFFLPLKDLGFQFFFFIMQNLGLGSVSDSAQ